MENFIIFEFLPIRTFHIAKINGVSESVKVLISFITLYNKHLK